MDRAEYAKKKYVELLYKKYRKNIPLSNGQMELLREAGHITEKGGKVREASYIAPKLSSRNASTEEWHMMMDPFRRKERYELMVPVQEADWQPESRLEHSKEFVNWINSMLYGSFASRSFYNKFDKYKAQAWQWLQDDSSYRSCKTREERQEYARKEFDRCYINTLYFANKYGELKEGDAESGSVNYWARESHAIIFYLCDCGYNIIGGKGRQIGFTSAIGLFAVKKLVFSANFFLKFISEDEDTSEEIFTDKIKYPFSALPSWMKPPVKSDRGERLWLSDKSRKGQKGYPDSRIDVIPPRATAINGGSPQLVLIDEIGNIGILTEMLNEGRPTMFWNNPDTGEFEMKRQVIMYGTGGYMKRGGGAYEKEWARIVSLWDNGRYAQSGFVPLFFSWHARLSKEEYIREKEWYYGARSSEEGIDLETSKAQFHQHYPDSPADMFIRTDNTLVSRDIITGGINRCKELSEDIAPLYGYFEPVYDFNEPAPPESDVPYKIVGAEFVPLGDDDDPRDATCIMFKKPEPGWVNRYYQGTDPIATETGHSKMSSAIWDDYYKTITALVNFRKQHDHKYTFLQCLLLGIYYDTAPGRKKGVPELVEANIGTNYIDYKHAKGLYDTLVFNAQLPSRLIGGARDVGLDNKGTRAVAIIDYMTEMIRTFHSRIYIRLIFDQLRTFVQKVTAAGKEVWGPQNKLMHYDDALYAATFAYICRLSFPHLGPKQTDSLKTSIKIRHELVRQADGTLIRKPVRKTVVQKVEEIPDL